MQLNESLFKVFVEGIQKWLPHYYSNIISSLTVDTSGYNMGFFEEPIYVFDFTITDDEMTKLEALSAKSKSKAMHDKKIDEELFEEYDRLAGFISILKFNYTEP